MFVLKSLKQQQEKKTVTVFASFNPEIDKKYNKVMTMNFSNQVCR